MSRSTRSMAASWSDATRRPVRIALDPTAGRVRCLGVDPGQLERPRAHPGAVTVAVRKERRPAADGRIEIAAVRGPVRDRAHEPAAAEDPLIVRVVGCV